MIFNIKRYRLIKSIIGSGRIRNNDLDQILQDASSKIILVYI